MLHRKCVLKTWFRIKAYSKRPRWKLADDKRQKTLYLDLLINGIKTILTGSLKTLIFIHRAFILSEGISIGGARSLCDSNMQEGFPKVTGVIIAIFFLHYRNRMFESQLMFNPVLKVNTEVLIFLVYKCF